MRALIASVLFLASACGSQLAEVKQLGDVAESARASCASATTAAKTLGTPAVVFEQRRRCRLALACLEPAKLATQASVAADQAIADGGDGFEERAVAKAARKAALSTCQAAGFRPRS